MLIGNECKNEQCSKVEEENLNDSFPSLDPQNPQVPIEAGVMSMLR